MPSCIKRHDLRDVGGQCSCFRDEQLRFWEQYLCFRLGNWLFYLDLHDRGYRWGPAAVSDGIVYIASTENVYALNANRFSNQGSTRRTLGIWLALLGYSGRASAVCCSNCTGLFCIWDSSLGRRRLGDRRRRMENSGFWVHLACIMRRFLAL